MNGNEQTTDLKPCPTCLSNGWVRESGRKVNCPDCDGSGVDAKVGFALRFLWDHSRSDSLLDMEVVP